MVRTVKNGIVSRRIGSANIALALWGVLATGCAHPAETTRGAALPAAEISTVAQLSKLQSSKAPAAQPILLRGEMIEKCPVAGCWFMLRDKTGVARIDTKAAGFVVSDLPLHTILTVAGKATPGVQAGLAATGIRY